MPSAWTMGFIDSELPMPTLASLALATFFLPAFVTPSSAHGGDPAVLHVCIGPLGVMRVVAPSEPCPRNHIAVHVPIGGPPAFSFYTVERPVETFGPARIRPRRFTAGWCGTPGSMSTSRRPAAPG
jgi:hypothetical protein